MQNRRGEVESLTAPVSLPWTAWTAAAQAEPTAPRTTRPMRSSRSYGGRDEDGAAPGARRHGLHRNLAPALRLAAPRFVKYPGLQHHGRTQLAPSTGGDGLRLPRPPSPPARCCTRTARCVNVDGDGDFLMTGRRWRLARTATGYGAAATDQHGGGRRQRTARSACTRSAEVPGTGRQVAATCSTPTSRRSGWPTAGARGDFSTTTAFEPAFAAALASGRPTLLHLRLDADVSTSRTTLTALRRAAEGTSGKMNRGSVDLEGADDLLRGAGIRLRISRANPGYVP